MPNRFIHEKSPYLLQHAHNPVEWKGSLSFAPRTVNRPGEVAPAGAPADSGFRRIRGAAADGLHPYAQRLGTGAERWRWTCVTSSLVEALFYGEWQLILPHP